eukprot:5426077-Prymnesium_polylepis.1
MTGAAASGSSACTTLCAACSCSTARRVSLARVGISTPALSKWSSERDTLETERRRRWPPYAPAPAPCAARLASGTSSAAHLSATGSVERSTFVLGARGAEAADATAASSTP